MGYGQRWSEGCSLVRVRDGVRDRDMAEGRDRGRCRPLVWARARSIMATGRGIGGLWLQLGLH